MVVLLFFSAASMEMPNPSLLEAGSVTSRQLKMSSKLETHATVCASDFPVQEKLQEVNNSECKVADPCLFHLTPLCFNLFKTVKLNNTFGT